MADRDTRLFPGSLVDACGEQHLGKRLPDLAVQGVEPAAIRQKPAESLEKAFEVWMRPVTSTPRDLRLGASKLDAQISTQRVEEPDEVLPRASGCSEIVKVIHVQKALLRPLELLVGQRATSTVIG